MQSLRVFIASLAGFYLSILFTSLFIPPFFHRQFTVLFPHFLGSYSQSSIYNITFSSYNRLTPWNSQKSPVDVRQACVYFIAFVSFSLRPSHIAGLGKGVTLR